MGRAGDQQVYIATTAIVGGAQIVSTPLLVPTEAQVGSCMVIVTTEAHDARSPRGRDGGRVVVFAGDGGHAPRACGADGRVQRGFQR